MTESIVTVTQGERPERGAEQFLRAAHGEASVAGAGAQFLEFVRRNPGKTVLVSAAIGIVLGRLLRRL